MITTVLSVITLGRANSVADALSRNVATLATMKIMLCAGRAGGLQGQFWVRPNLRDRIIEAQSDDPEVGQIREDIGLGKGADFTLTDGVLVQGNRLYVPQPLRIEILEDILYRPYAVHPGSTKMYHDLWSCYIWKGMKKHVADYVSRCLSCQQIKAEPTRRRTCTLVYTLGAHHYGLRHWITAVWSRL